MKRGRASVPVRVGVGVAVGGIALAVLATNARATVVDFVPHLDRPTPVMAGELVLRGELRSALDGSTFDAITERDHYPRFPGEPAPRVGGLIDPEAGGLRVIEQDPERHVYRLVATGAPGRACREGGVASPCLAPRLMALAHERLATADDLAATLAGRFEAELIPGPTRPLITAGDASAVEWGGALAAVLGVGALGRAIRRARRARRARVIAQVRVAAAEARRALRGQLTFARARDQIQTLVARAETLERSRRACAARLTRLDAGGLDARRAAWAGSAAPDAGAALIALAAEADEAGQLAADLSSSVAGLERIASSLRTLALRARADRGTPAIAAQDDPVEVLLGELALRDDAAQEAEYAALPPMIR